MIYTVISLFTADIQVRFVEQIDRGDVILKSLDQYDVHIYFPSFQMTFKYVLLSRMTEEMSSGRVLVCLVHMMFIGRLVWLITCWVIFHAFLSSAHFFQN